MYENICEMINSAELSFEDFLKMHPFSESKRRLFRKALKEIDYFDKLYVKSINTYLTLAMISKVLSTSHRNLVFITGYRGCGKTNFLKYIEYIINGGIIGDTLKITRDKQVDNQVFGEVVEEINKNYKEAIDEIYDDKVTGGVISKTNIEGIALNNYIQRTCKGKTKYINFDIGGFILNRPLSSKLYLEFEKDLRDIIIPQKKLSEMIDVIDGFVKRNKDEIKQTVVDEHSKTMNLREFWKSAKGILGASTFDDSQFSQILELLKKLSLTDILFVYFFWELTWKYVIKADKTDKLVYLFDNIDVITNGDGRVFRNTIMGIFSFISRSNSLFARVEEKEANIIDSEICEYYNNLNLIISMRETSTMMVSNHALKLVKQNMEPIDLYNNTDTRLILKRRIELGNELIETGNLRNSLFIEKLTALKSLLKDGIFMEKLFLMNNNDVRTSDQLLSRICDNQLSYAKVIRGKGYDKSAHVFGMRGIVYKRIFDLFANKNYFRELLIYDYSNVQDTKTYRYSNARVILVMLHKHRKKSLNNRALNDNDKAEYVELKSLYNDVESIIPLNDFVSILDKMYSTRDSEYWNHLITFDNISNYTVNGLTKYIKAKTHTNDKMITVQITPAGERFLEQICIHFEYFAVRFVSTPHLALFEYNCFGDENDAKTVNSIIKIVFNAVSECTIALKEYDAKVKSLFPRTDQGTILNSSYYYNQQYHTERICFSHIQYLNAYRRYMMDTQDRKSVV